MVHCSPERRQRSNTSSAIVVPLATTGRQTRERPPSGSCDESRDSRTGATLCARCWRLGRTTRNEQAEGLPDGEGDYEGEEESDEQVPARGYLRHNQYISDQCSVSKKPCDHSLSFISQQKYLSLCTSNIPSLTTLLNLSDHTL